MPILMPGISSNSRVTVFLTLRRTCVRQGYMLPVVSKLKTTSTAGVAMIGLLVSGGFLDRLCHGRVSDQWWWWENGADRRAGGVSPLLKHAVTRSVLQQGAHAPRSPSGVPSLRRLEQRRDLGVGQLVL